MYVRCCDCGGQNVRYSASKTTEAITKVFRCPDCKTGSKLIWRRDEQRRWSLVEVIGTLPTLSEA